MNIIPLDGNFSVCKVKDFSQVNLQNDFTFTGKTDEENSLVCRTGHVPENTTAREDGWRAMRVEGTMEFSLIGVLSSISSALAREQIGIFAISTYNTDYILTKEENFDRALRALEKSGIEIIK